MTIKNKYDVAVIGGGPSGSRVAFQLAEKGRRVVVLERQASPVEKCCTGIVSIECVNNFDIPDSIILRRVNSARLFSPSGIEIHLKREEPQAVILNRATFDTFMRGRAEKAGAEYLFGHKATDIKINFDNVVIITSKGDRETKIEAKAIVMACGYTPALLRKTGLGDPRDFAYGAQAEVETTCAEVEVYFGDMAPGFFAWLTPVMTSKARAGLLTRGNAGELLKKWLLNLKSTGKIVSSEVPIKYGAVPLKPPTHTYSERIMAVGDAAGQVKPTTGGGIYYGLIGSDIAATVLNKALTENDLSEKSLSRYEKAWRRKLGSELRTGYWARKLLERMNDKQIDRLFKAIKRGSIDDALLKTPEVSFDWHSRTIKQLFKYQMINRTLNIVKKPFS
jgi:digeranylgeranylglycerophospholipid reductase